MHLAARAISSGVRLTFDPFVLLFPAMPVSPLRCLASMKTIIDVTVNDQLWCGVNAFCERARRATARGWWSAWATVNEELVDKAQTDDVAGVPAGAGARSPRNWLSLGAGGKERDTIRRAVCVGRGRTARLPRPPATSAPVDHASRTGWGRTVRLPCDGGPAAGGGGAEPVPLAPARSPVPALPPSTTVLGRPMPFGCSDEVRRPRARVGYTC